MKVGSLKGKIFFGLDSQARHMNFENPRPLSRWILWFRSPYPGFRAYRRDSDPRFDLFQAQDPAFEAILEPSPDIFSWSPKKFKPRSEPKFRARQHARQHAREARWFLDLIFDPNFGLDFGSEFDPQNDPQIWPQTFEILRPIVSHRRSPKSPKSPKLPKSS